MKPARDPRLLSVVILLLIAVAFLGGAVRLIGAARAADNNALAEKVVPAGGISAGRIFLPLFVSAQADLTATPVPTGLENGNTTQSTPTPVPVSADTGGIIALAIVIVVTVVLGSFVGVRGSAPKKTTSK
jgi:hypothetical protein